MRSSVKEVRNGKEYYLHTIQKGQSLYMISKTYGVDINEVIRENPEVKEGIKAGQVILIPTGRVIESPKKKEKKNETPVKKEPAETVIPPPTAELPCGSDASLRKKSYKVALMMPLYLSEVDDIVVGRPYNDSVEYRPLNFIQFYEGFSLALDSLKKRDVGLEIHVYDVDKDTAKTRRLLRDPEIKEMDLIIGLLYNSPFRIVSEFALRNTIPIVNPLSEREQIIRDNPMVFKVRPSLSGQSEHVAEFLQKNAGEKNIVIFPAPESKMRELASQLQAACQEHSVPIRTVESYTACLGSLVAGKDNIVVVISEKKVFALDIITRLNEVRNTYPLTVIGLPHWDRIEGLETEYLVNLKTHIVAPGFTDYSDTLVQQFVRRFQSVYKTDPGSLAFQGFDVTWFFLNALSEYGRSIRRCIPEYRIRLLETSLHFEGKKGEGFLNSHWEIYLYDNYFLRRAGR